MIQEPMNDVSLREYYTSYTLKNNLSIEFNILRFLRNLIHFFKSTFKITYFKFILKNIEIFSFVEWFTLKKTAKLTYTNLLILLKS